MPGELVSRFELCRDDIMAEFALISTDNDFRTDGVKVVNAIRRTDLIISSLVDNQAEIGVVMGKAIVEGNGTTWTNFNAKCDVWVQAVIRTSASSQDASETLNTALEGLRQDVLKVCATLMTKYINNYAGRWNILPVPFEAVPSTDLGGKNNVGAVALKFVVQLRSMSGTFA